MSKIGVYPGSFDPITKGHIDVIQKAIQLCDKVFVVVAINEDKKHMFSIEDRTQIVKESMKKITIPEGKEIEVVQYAGVISNLVHELGANTMIRGIRDHIDLSYELNIEQFTKLTAPDILTVYFTADAQNVYTSSSLIRQFIITGFIDKAEPLVPKGTFALIKKLSKDKIMPRFANPQEIIRVEGIFSN